MDHISTLLPKALQKHGLKGQADASIIVHKANLWLGKFENLKGAQATVFKDRTLRIEVDNSATAQECHIVTHELLDELNKQFPDIKIEKVNILRKLEKASYSI